jgi:tetratricopeptide (TPR) repeat protein
MDKSPKALLEEINTLFKDRKYDDIIIRSSSLPDIDDKEISEEVKSLLALSYFRKDNFVQALPLFEGLALSKNDDVLSWFNVMTSAILSSNIQKGKDAFNRVLELKKTSDGGPEEPSSSDTRYYYAYAMKNVGLFDEALEQLDELKKIYMKLVITDDNFLFLRGVPFISRTLTLAKEVFDSLGLNFPQSEWLEELRRNVDDDGKETIDRYKNK